MNCCDIVIIDDENDICDLVSGILNDEGYNTKYCQDSEAAIKLLESCSPRLVFLDVWLEGSRMDGLALLNYIKNNHADIPVIMISGHGNIETAVSAIKRGAYDFIEKPFNSDRLLLATERALENSMLRRQVNELKKQKSESLSLIGDSQLMKKLRQNIERIASTNSRVVLVGPSGCGKDLVARTIHAQSSRSQYPFVVVNAASITPENMEEELFGAEFGNGKRKLGLIESAHLGTLYIDELADLTSLVQAKLLRWLTVNSFSRKGGSENLFADVRVITATSYDIKKLVETGKFRKDLYHRLAVVPISVPSLEERRTDIPLLIEYFIQQLSQKEGIKVKELAQDAIAILQSYNWPGNLRQLRNNIERLLILAQSTDDKVITAKMLPPEICDPLAKDISSSDQNIMSLPLREARELFERKYLLSKIEMFGGNISRTADNIGMERSALHRKLKLLHIN